MIKILIADDSITESALLKGIIEAEADMEVIGQAHNGQEAVELCAALKPDLITMDVNMPILGGYDATRLIMSQNPTPIIIISSNSSNESLQAAFEAMESGALTVLPKPINITSKKFTIERQYMVDTLRSMVQIKVFKKSFNVSKNKISSIPKTQIKKQIPYQLVALGASVGGPQALHFILSKLPANFPIPIVIVQHMTPGFINGFAKWLEDNIEITVKIAEDGELLKSGIVYFAPDGKHLTVAGDKCKVCLTDTAPVSGFKPSVTVLFESVAKTCGSLAIGALLTGMGSDGAKGLLQIKNLQGKTFIQDETSAIVFGMGGVAQSLGAVDEVVNLDKIPSYLIYLTKKSLII